VNTFWSLMDTNLWRNLRQKRVSERSVERPVNRRAAARLGVGAPRADDGGTRMPARRSGGEATRGDQLEPIGEAMLDEVLRGEERPAPGAYCLCNGAQNDGLQGGQVFVDSSYRRGTTVRRIYEH
jgi:hypothetical protein